MPVSERLPVVSTDGHCGADLLDYRPYLEARYHDDFDVWAATYVDGWSQIDADFPPLDPDFRAGAASWETSFNWDSARRLRLTEDQGIVAEVLFPNTSPPFIPSGSISAPAPRSAREYELRFAGLRAHNRWLADFCNDAPGRRAGCAQIFLDDVDAAVAEVRWARQAGLGGVLLPSDHTLKMVNLYYPRYDPLWAACAEVGLPVHRHVVLPTEAPTEGGDASTWIGSLELPFYNSRALLHLICSGVFERHPALKFVVTEISTTTTVPAALAQADAMYRRARDESSEQIFPFRAAVEKLSRKPSDYFATNCYLGGPLDLVHALAKDVPNVMFGADIPHAEGTAPYTRQALRVALRDRTDDEVHRIAWRTAADVYGFDVVRLAEVAHRVGPTLDEIMTPLPAEERPRYPAQTRSRIFSDSTDPRNTDNTAA